MKPSEDGLSDLEKKAILYAIAVRTQRPRSEVVKREKELIEKALTRVEVVT